MENLNLLIPVHNFSLLDSEFKEKCLNHLRPALIDGCIIFIRCIGGPGQELSISMIPGEKSGSHSRYASGQEIITAPFPALACSGQWIPFTW